MGISLIGLFQTTASGNRYVCTMTDLFSKYVFAEAIPYGCQRCPCPMSYLYGPPHSMISDQGREFVNELNDNVFTLLGIRHSVTSAYHPQSNGQDECTNKTVKHALAKYTNEEYPQAVARSAQPLWCSSHGSYSRPHDLKIFAAQANWNGAFFPGGP
ncbi:hypothetical protein LSH36_1353g00041 [Paralvinella palmiformis]|uniref:Integrase catalytic domain-containing protein n=1 Tax=Paralvinella palmiformis TaxID=53620 RepID=A0AAD9ITI0_9ANNE|nr:hypothetical protein LSH36_1353g00041 [Paralvinella palmiformis]